MMFPFTLEFHFILAIICDLVLGLDMYSYNQLVVELNYYLHKSEGLDTPLIDSNY